LGRWPALHGRRPLRVIGSGGNLICSYNTNQTATRRPRWELPRRRGTASSSYGNFFPGAPTRTCCSLGQPLQHPVAGRPRRQHGLQPASAMCWATAASRWSRRGHRFERCRVRAQRCERSATAGLAGDDPGTHHCGVTCRPDQRWLQRRARPTTTGSRSSTQDGQLVATLGQGAVALQNSALVTTDPDAPSASPSPLRAGKKASSALRRERLHRPLARTALVPQFHQNSQLTGWLAAAPRSPQLADRGHVVDADGPRVLERGL